MFIRNARWFALAASLALVVFTGCTTDSDDSEKVEYSITRSPAPTSVLKYVRSGGGENSFLVHDSVSFYELNVLTLNFQASSAKVRVQKSSLADSVREVFDSVFAGTQNISGTIDAQTAPTGTWNYLYIYDNGAWIRVANARLIRAAEKLEAFVVGTGGSTTAREGF